VESAISDARRNAALNGIEQTEFHVGKAEQLMPALHADGVSADVVVMDPPRKGCDKAVLRPWWPWRRAVWSMSPATPDPGPGSRLAGQQGFVLDEVQPVDMFPHSMHVEAVAPA
jgi:23S rRNA (uracil1939-C5)-methyltransferase